MSIADWYRLIYSDIKWNEPFHSFTDEGKATKQEQQNNDTKSANKLLNVHNIVR